MKLSKHLSKKPWLVQADYLEQFMDLNTDDLEIEANAAGGWEFAKAINNNMVISVSGVLARYNNCVSMLFDQTTYQGIRSSLDSAINDSSIKAIIMDFDTPGGMVNGVSELGDFIAEAKKKKPIYAHVSNMAASAGYWLASQCTSIQMAKTAVVGSIGVVATIVKSSEDDDETYEIVSSNAPNKRLKAGTEDFDNAVQKELDGLETIFLETVANGRGVSVDTVRSDFGGGSTFLAEEAISRGMADGIGTLEELISQKSEGEKMTDSKSKSDALIAANSEELGIAVAKAKTDERERVLAIMGSAEANGRKELALKLAKTDLSAVDAEGIMASAPRAEAQPAKAESTLSKLMANEENNPQVPRDVAGNVGQAEAKDESEDPDLYAKQLKAMGEI